MASKSKVKPAPAKTVRKARAKKVDNILWVLSERTKLFIWKPIKAFKSYELAADARRAAEESSPYSLNGYKVDRVELV